MSMKSPFAGMDPYLERSWGDVHTRLITSSSAILNKLLPDDLIARVEERVAIGTSAGEDEPVVQTSVIPDARVFEFIGQGTTPSAVGGNVALAPFQLELLNEAVTERFIEIIDVSDGERLVTVLEFVSPSNKQSEGLKAFINKRNALIAGGVNFLEIDLVRTGNWRRLLGPYRAPAAAVSTYRAVIRVPGEPVKVYLHPISLREPLPTLKVPLRSVDTPCDLNLQPLMDDAYGDGRYGRTISYSRSCEPPLSSDDAAWAEQLLRAIGKQ